MVPSFFINQKMKVFVKKLNQISKANKGTDMLKKLHNVLPINSLITIYKSFIQTHLDYGAIIFDQPENKSFCKVIESVQYNAELAISLAI